MAAMAVRVKRVTVPFDDTARARLYDSHCSSSGSEHYPKQSPELADLVHGFMEKDDDYHEEQGKEKSGINDSGEIDNDSGGDSGYEGMMGMLKSLVTISADDPFQRRIQIQTAHICRKSAVVSPDFRRWLMIQLREIGLDAGLCKSRWEKFGSCPGGDYEYVDVVTGKQRYFVEVDLAGNFEIARPTSHYLALVQLFPSVFVGGHNSLKQIVQLMCEAAKESLKIREMHIPPWRRNSYMQAKWFSAYKRTINAIPAIVKPDSGGFSTGKRSVGFVGILEPPLTNCRQISALRETLKQGHLTVAMKETHL